MYLFIDPKNGRMQFLPVEVVLLLETIDAQERLTDLVAQLLRDSFGSLRVVS